MGLFKRRLFTICSLRMGSDSRGGQFEDLRFIQYDYHIREKEPRVLCKLMRTALGGRYFLKDSVFTDDKQGVKFEKHHLLNGQLHFLLGNFSRRCFTAFPHLQEYFLPSSRLYASVDLLFPFR